MRNVYFIILIIFSSVSLHAQEETDQQKQMAKQMMQWMDQVWDSEPEEGKAHVRFLILKNGEPLSGEVSINGRLR